MYHIHEYKDRVIVLDASGDVEVTIRDAVLTINDATPRNDAF